MKRPWILCNQLLAAIEVGDVAAAAEVIDNGFDVDTLLMEGKSAISICVERGKIKIAHLLVKRGCSLSLRSPNGVYPLHLAVLNGDTALVDMLLDNRADVTAVDFCGKAALHIACEMNIPDIAKALIDRSNSSNLNIADGDGRTALMYACQYSSKDLVEYLLQKGSIVNVSDVCGESPLLQCIANVRSSSEMMRCLLNAGANVRHQNYRGESPLLRALRHSYVYQGGRRNVQYLEMALMLIDHDSNLKVTNSLGQTPLHLAVCANDEVVVKKLINAGCKVDVFDQLGLSPIYYACRNANRKILNLLVKSGANLKIYDWYKLKENLKMPDSCALVDELMQITREMQPLRALCRTVIRKCFKSSIEKNAKFLPIPALLSNFIINFDN